MKRARSSRVPVPSGREFRIASTRKLTNAFGAILILASFPLFVRPPSAQAETATATITAGTTPQAAAVNPITNKIYVVNRDTDDVTVIDGATNAATTVSVGDGPVAVAVNTVTNQIYVVNSISDNVTVIDGATNGTTPVSVGNNPSAVAVNPVTNKVYVTSAADNNVTVIDGATNTVDTTVDVGITPQAIAVNHVTNKIYVANTFGSSVTVIDGATNLETTINTGQTQISAIAVNPVTNKIYAANTGSSTITVIDGATNGTTTVTPSPLFAPVAIAVNPVTNQYIAVGTGPGPSFFRFSTVFNGSDNSVAGSHSVGSSPAAVAVNPVTNRVYVVNSASGTVTAHTAEFAGEVTVTVGTSPSALAVNPVTNKIYVANNGSGNVTVIDGATNGRSTVATGDQPETLAVNPVTHKIYVANYSGGDVTVIDGATNGTTTVSTGTNPAGVAVNPLTNKIYVSNRGSNTVTVIDGDTEETTSVAVGTEPVGIAVNPATNKIYVVNNVSNNVTVIDGTNNATSTVAVGLGPLRIAVNPVTNMIYVSNGDADNVTVIDGDTHSTNTVTIGGGPGQLAVNPVTNKIYVIDGSDDAVAIIDGASNGVTSVSAGVFPSALAVNPVTNRIYVSSIGTEDVTVIDGVTTETTTVPVGMFPRSVAVNPATNKIYVVNNGDNNITIIDGATETTTTVSDTSAMSAHVVAVDPISNKAYVANLISNNVTVITEQNVQSVPLAAAITPLPGNSTDNPSPSFNFTVSSAFAPTAPGINGLFFQVDTLQGEWMAGTIDSDFQGTLPVLQQGFHILYAFSTDGQDATSINTGKNSSPLISNIAAYGFVIGPPPAPAVQLSTLSLNFGEQLVDITSPVMQVTLTNGGNATLNFTSFNVQLSTSDTTPSPHFSSNNNCGTTLGMGLPCTINVFFTPLVTGPFSAVVKIVSDAPGSPHFITLSGIGISDGAVSGLPANFDFGDQAVGTTSSPPHIFTLNNTGPGTLGISNIAVTGNFARFANGGSCGSTVAAFTSCNIEVEFSPLTLGANGGTLTITHDGAGSPAVVILTGNGVLVDPVAFINQPLVPTRVSPGSGAFTLDVFGTGFTANSIVHWNGNPRTTTFVNSSQVTADILSVDVATATTAEVGVDNPAPGGDGSIRSNIVFFHVTNPATSVAMSKTDFAVGDQPVFVATQDFNGDGLLDLAVANAQSVTVSILLGNGDGTFQPQSTVATGVGPFSVATGDFNADGQLDLAVANLSSNTVSILLGIGDGTFQANVEYATGSFPFSAITGDFNVDGKLDLAVTNRSDDTVSILLGNGDGTFQTQTTFVTGSGPVSPMAGDFNGDGKLDLALANAFADTVSILLGSGTGTFSANVDFATGSNPVSVTTADFNADGKLDLAVTNAGDDTVSILLGIGDGTFQAQTSYATGAFPLSVTTGEFNGDDMLDLAVPNSSDNTVGILLGIGDGTFQPQSTFATGSAPRFPAAGDFNGDGKLDLAVANRSDDTVSVLLQTPPPTTLLGPTPYLSQADSPFFADIQAGNMYLETFEDGLFNTLGVTASTGSAIGPGGLTDSVDSDDGSIDGSGTSGRSFFSGAGPTGIAFNFNSTALGSFPTKAGIVWTDAGGGATATFEAFDAAGASLGVVGPTGLADGSNSGTTAEDRFFGAVNPDGISKIHISNSSGGIEVDHLQYGLFTGASPLSFDRASVDFGSISVGSTSSGENIVVSNSATFPVNFTSIGVTGDFAIKVADTDCPIAGGALGAGASCNLDLEFSPTVADPHMGFARIVSDASGSPHVIPVAGVGLGAGAPAVQLSPTSVNFSGNPLNLTCPTKDVTLTNPSGNPSLDIVSIVATAPFGVASHTCPATMAAGTSCIIKVNFSPSVVGNNQAGTLTVTTNPVTTGNTVNLTGNGTPSCQLLARVRSVTVLRGADVQDFAIEDAKPSCSPVELNLTCSVDNPAACLLNPAVIAPSGASTLKVSNLRRIGAESLQIDVTSTSEFRQATERVTVRFADFAFTQSPEAATVAAGGATSYAVAIRPVNGLSGDVALTCSGAPRGATCAVEPANITLDGTSLAQVRVRVTTAGRAGAAPLTGIDLQRFLPVLALLLGLMLLAGAANFARRIVEPREARIRFRSTRQLRWAILSAMMLAMLVWASCGGGGGSMNFGANATPAGSYTLTITGTYSSATGPTPGTLSNFTTVTLRVN